MLFRKRYTSYGDWPICHRFFLTPGLEPTEENAIADWGDGRGGREVAMDSPQTLTDFINWSTKNYPAKKYALVAADHGFGWQGLCMDITSDQGRMFLNEFQQALNNANEDMDLLLLDDCEMQTIEVAFQLKSIGPRLLVGSQCTGSAWPYWDFLTAFTQKTSLSELQIAKRVVDAYYNWNKGYENATLSVVDLTKIEALAAKVKELALSMRHSSDFSVVQAKARAVMPLVEGVVKYAKNVGYWQTYAHGISIYFPKAPIQKIPGPPDIFDNYYIGKVTDFARQMAWRDFLYCYYSRVSPPPELKCQVDIKISDVRKQMTEIGGTKGDIDLYDFCKRLVDVKLEK